jgi:hypothetical protein
MKTKIIYTTESKISRVPIPQWVSEVMRINTEGIMAEYNANLEYLKIILPKAKIYLWAGKNRKIKWLMDVSPTKNPLI